MIRSNTQSYTTKLTRDYNSNISCLPGSYVNSQAERPILLNSRKNQTSDIFNTNTQNVNTFKVSNKKFKSQIFGESHNEKKLVDNGRAGRPGQIRNVFSSQIQLI